MEKVYIISAKRSAIGKFLGSLSDVKPGDIAAQVIRRMIADVSLDPAAIDEIFIGHQHSAGQGPSIARRAQIEAGIPAEVPATTVNMQCGSGLKAAMLGFAAIRAGSDIVLCGGVESMSEAPFILDRAVRKGVKMGDNALGLRDSLFCDGLIDQFSGYLMGMTAENVAEITATTREEQDAFALASQTRAARAVESGRFREEIVPIRIHDRKGRESVFDTDESYTPGTTAEGLAALRPAFKKDGTVTAGNSSQLNDGAAMLILASQQAIREHGWKPLGEIVSVGQVGINPAIMGLGPVKAITKALDEAKLTLIDIGLIELNEAFAAQSVGVLKQLSSRYGVSLEDLYGRTNVNGGAIALGHPVAASGARITTTLLYEMRRRPEVEYGVASLCVGGGIGVAAVIRKTNGGVTGTDARHCHVII